MTKEQEKDVIKMMNTHLRWSVGIFMTLAIAIVSMKIVEVRTDALFKGEVKTEIKGIKQVITEIKGELKDKTSINKVSETEGVLKETMEDVRNAEFFLSAKFGYVPIQRN